MTKMGTRATKIVTLLIWFIGAASQAQPLGGQNDLNIINQGASGGGEFGRLNYAFYSNSSVSLKFEPTTTNQNPAQKIEVRNDFNLKVTRRYTLNLSPQAFGLRKPVKLPEGFYLLRWAITRPAINTISNEQKDLPPMNEDERYITGDEKLVRFSKKDGIHESVNMEFPDPSVLGQETIFYFSIVPVDQTKIIVTPNGDIDEFRSKADPLPKSVGLPGAMKFIPILEDMQGRSLPTPTPNEINSDPILRDLTGYIARNKDRLAGNGNFSDLSLPPTPTEKYALDHKLQYINSYSPLLQNVLQLPPRVGKEPPLQFNYTKLNELVEMTSELYQTIPAQIDPIIAGTFCLLVSYQSPSRDSLLRSDDCIKNPHKYLHFYRTIHAETINTAKVIGLQDKSTRQSMMGNLAANHSTGSDLWINSGVSLPLSKVISVTPVNLTVTSSDSYSLARTGINQSQSSIIRTPFYLTIPVHSYRSCLAVMAKKIPQDSKENRGLYICGSRQQNLKLKTWYYYIFQDTFGTTMGDQGVHAIFRDQYDFNLFYHTLERYLNTIKDNPTELQNLWRNAYDWYEEIRGPADPGVLKFPIYTANDRQDIEKPSELADPGLYRRFRWLFFGTPMEKQ